MKWLKKFSLFRIELHWTVKSQRVMPEADVWQTTRLLCKTPLHCPLVVNIGNTALQKKKVKPDSNQRDWMFDVRTNMRVFFLFLFSQMEKRLSNYSIILICSSYGTSKHAMQAAGSASEDHTIPTCDTYKDEIRHIPRPSINYLSIIIKLRARLSDTYSISFSNDFARLTDRAVIRRSAATTHVWLFTLS